MIYSLVTLKELIEEQIVPQAIIRQPLNNEQVAAWTSDVQSHIRQIRQWFFAEAGAEKEKFRLLLQLVDLSNAISHYLHSLRAIWSERPSASVIKSFYLDLLRLLETGIEQLKRTEPNMAENVPLTNYSLPEALKSVKLKLVELRLQLDAQSINATLKTPLLNSVQQYLRKPLRTMSDIEYLESIISALLNSPTLTTKQVEDILYMYDFNPPDLFIYHISKWQDQLQDIAGLHQQLEMVIHEADRLGSLAVKTSRKLLPGQESLRLELKSYLDEKSEVIRQLIKLRRTILKDKELASTSIRTKINLSVAQFALFIRLQIEKGLLPKENIGELFSFFAAHFYTPQTIFISAESLQKKSTDVEYATATKLKGYLIEMINWLNEHFRLSESK